MAGEKRQEVGSRPGVRVLIEEPFSEVRALLERAVLRLGLEPVSRGAGWEEGELPDVDVLVLEPAFTDGVALARALRKAKPGLPVICAYGSAPGQEVGELEPVVYLAKPFALAELEAALKEAVRRAASTSSGEA